MLVGWLPAMAYSLALPGWLLAARCLLSKSSSNCSSLAFSSSIKTGQVSIEDLLLQPVLSLCPSTDRLQISVTMVRRQNWKLRLASSSLSLSLEQDGMSDGCEDGHAQRTGLHRRRQDGSGIRWTGRRIALNRRRRLWTQTQQDQDAQGTFTNPQCRPTRPPHRTP